MQRNDKKIKELLNEHIPQEPALTEQASCAISATAESVHPEFARFGINLILLLAPVLSPAAVVDTNVLVQKL